MESSETQATMADSSAPETSLAKGKDAKNWPWLLLVLLLVVGGGGFAIWRLRSGGEPAQQMMQGQSVPVQLETLEQGTIEDSALFVGELEAQQGIVLRPESAGRVVQLFVSEGDTVAAGDPILELSPERSQAEVSAALASVSAARSAQNTAQAQLRVLEAQRAQAVATLDLQNEELRRTQYLVTEGAQTQQALDVVQRDRTAAQATLNAAEEQIRAAQASVAESNAALARAEAQAAAAQEDLQDKRVAAPIAGVVGDIPIELGDYVNTGDALTNIVQNQTLNLQISVPIEQRDQLRTGLPVELIRFEGEEPLATGRISFVSPQVNAATQSILAKASFPNARGLLQDAQRVQARVIWRQRSGVLVPATAISRLGGQTFVFVAQKPQEPAEDGPQLIARQQMVQLGDLQGNRYQVIEGLEAGDTIVVSGILNLSDGAPIQPQSDSPPSAVPPAAQE